VIGSDNPHLWIQTPELERILTNEIVGISLKELPLRTRSKVVKEHVCLALGYQVPSKFARTQPRFVGQDFDVYVQKSGNLQIWNEELDPERRYVIVRVGEDDAVAAVRVVTGNELAALDRTGALTQKYQARLDVGQETAELVVQTDTEGLCGLVMEGVELPLSAMPISNPEAFQMFSIVEIFHRLRSLIGMSFADAGSDQERNRGAALQRIVCHCLGYRDFLDDGRYPDIRHQLLELKLQTSPTIDLGLVCPDSTAHLEVPSIARYEVKHCDVRYAIFYAKSDGKEVTLTNLFVTTGEMFFSRFPRFEGNVLNKKLQIPLPGGFFDN